MKAETFFKTIAWLQGACAIQHAPMQGMIDILYGELKDKYTDEQITTAAREIATKEELYGNYPALRVWLKYAPSVKAEKAEWDKIKTEFLDLVSAVMWLDHLIYDQGEMKKKILALGWRAYNAFMRAGISLQNLRGYHHTSETQKKQVLEKFSKAWDEVDDKDPRPKKEHVKQIVAEQPLPLITKIESNDDALTTANLFFEKKE